MRALAGLAALAVGCGDDGGTSTPRPDGAVTAGDTSISAEGWTTGTAVGSGPIQETAAVAVAGKIYLIGGFVTGGGITDRVQVYDTATGAWSDAPALPRPLHHANAATDGTTIYIAGALSGTGFVAIADVYSLDPATQTEWQTRAPLPAGRERGSAVTDFVDGKLVVAGGFRNSASSNLVDIYDPGTNQWTALATLPGIRDHACGGTIAGELVVASGRTGAPRADVWSIDPDTNEWITRASMPTPRGGMGCGVIDGVLYTAGGEGNDALPSGVFANVEAYTLASDSWEQLEPMPNPKHGVAGAVWDGALYLCGGADQEGFGAIADTDIFRP